MKKDIRVKEAEKKINEAINLLKEVINDPNSSLSDMADVVDYTRLLDVTDFTKTILG